MASPILQAKLDTLSILRDLTDLSRVNFSLRAVVMHINGPLSHTTVHADKYVSHKLSLTFAWMKITVIKGCERCPAEKDGIDGAIAQRN